MCLSILCIIHNLLKDKIIQCYVFLWIYVIFLCICNSFSLTNCNQLEYLAWRWRWMPHRELFHACSQWHKTLSDAILYLYSQLFSYWLLSDICTVYLTKGNLFCTEHFLLSTMFLCLCIVSHFYLRPETQVSCIKVNK